MKLASSVTFFHYIMLICWAFFTLLLPCSIFPGLPEAIDLASVMGSLTANSHNPATFTLEVCSLCVVPDQSKL